MKTFLKIISLIILILVFMTVALIAIINVAFDGYEYAHLFIISLFSITFLFIAFYIFNFFINTRRIAVFCIASALILLGTSIKPLHEYYKKNIPVLSTEVDVRKYQPFTDSRMLARLDEPASIRIQAPLPRLDGATALYPLYAAFVEATYPKGSYPPDLGPVKVMKTSYAYLNLRDGDADLIFVAAPSAEQRAQLGPKIKLTPFGYEAFVFFVNRRNPVDSLTVAQIQDIYSGKITNWKEVGGKDTPIRAYQRAESSGSQSALVRFMGDIPLQEAPKEDVVAFMGAIIDQVANYKNFHNAIGYSFRYFSTEMVQNGDIKLLKINGVAPTREAIRAGEYPITETLYAVSAGSQNPNIAPFIEWILSAEGQELVEKTGYVALGSR